MNELSRRDLALIYVIYSHNVNALAEIKAQKLPKESWASLMPNCTPVILIGGVHSKGKYTEFMKQHAAAFNGTVEHIQALMRGIEKLKAARLLYPGGAGYALNPLGLKIAALLSDNPLEWPLTMEIEGGQLRVNQALRPAFLDSVV